MGEDCRRTGRELQSGCRVGVRPLCVWCMCGYGVCVGMVYVCVCVHGCGVCVGVVYVCVVYVLVWCVRSNTLCHIIKAYTSRLEAICSQKKFRQVYVIRKASQ